MPTTVGNIMSNYVLAVREDATFGEIAAKMLEHHVSALPVVDSDDQVLGVVSDADLLVKEAAVADPAAWGSYQRGRRGDMATAELARDLMTRPAITIGPEASVAEAALLMKERRVKQLPVVTGPGRLVGILSRVDILSIFGRPDDEIRAEVTSTITAGPLGATPGLEVTVPGGLEVTVRSGIVTVSGDVPTHGAAVQLLQAIRHVEGVVNVRSQLSFPTQKLAGGAVVVGPS